MASGNAEHSDVLALPLATNVRSQVVRTSVFFLSLNCAWMERLCR